MAREMKQERQANTASFLLLDNRVEESLKSCVSSRMAVMDRMNLKNATFKVDSDINYYRNKL